MIKYEMKVEIADNEKVRNLIEESYLNSNGKLTKGGKIIFEKGGEEFEELKNLNKNTIKISNQELILGTLRCIVEERDDSITIKPISLYCVDADGKYSFY